MKATLFYLSFIASITCCLVSCKKEDTIQEEHCVKGVFCYGIGGENFVSDPATFDQYGNFSGGTYVELQKTAFSGGSFVDLRIEAYDLLKNTTLDISIPSPVISDSATYYYSERSIRTVVTRPDKQIQDMTNWCDGYNSQLTNGYVKITAIDTAAKFVSGYFNVPVTCYSRETDGLWIYYENQMLTGYFDSIPLKKTGGPWW